MTTVAPGPMPHVGPGRPDRAAARLSATINRLAADDFTGRRVGTAGGRAAGTWLAGRLRDRGLAVTTAEFTATGVRELYQKPLLDWHTGSQIHRLTHRRDFAEHLASAELDAARRAVIATADAEVWHDRWVLAPGLDDAVVARAARDGAAGLLVPRGVDEAGWMPKMLTGRATVPIPVISVRRSIHADMAARPGQVTASMPLRVTTATGMNVYGSVNAAAPVSILLTAHYDGVGDDADMRFPSAADNGSGVAVVLEAVGRLLTAPLANTGLSVALLDAEEAGALGAAHHARSVPPGTFVINVDGVAGSDRLAHVEGGGPAQSLLAALDQAGRLTGLPLRAGAMASDNRRYAAAGLPSIGIGMGIPGYQTPAETPDRVSVATMLAATDLVVATVRRLADGTATGDMP